MSRKITVAELFAGVGGFRLGLEGNPEGNKDTRFSVIFSNQWEPQEKAQWASRIYVERFGPLGHSNNNIQEFTEPIKGISNIPDHDLLVGGFPCQDYSVARTLSGELGIEGEKGKLWIDIAKIIRFKRPRPKIVLLENVPRILNSPSNARGLNFSIILNDLITMGYNVEWRVINAADYGMPQQRSRVFIFAYRGNWCGQNVSVNGKERYGALNKSKKSMEKWIIGKSSEESANNHEIGPFAEAFPAMGELSNHELIFENLEHFSSKKSPFGNAGYAYQSGNGPYIKKYWTGNLKPVYNGQFKLLRDVLEETFDPKFEINIARINEWEYVKGSKKEFRLRKKDRKNINKKLLDLYDYCLKAPFEQRAKLWRQNRSIFLASTAENSFYQYNEGKMNFDKLDKPSRTIVTDEIGKTPSRMRHIIQYDNNKFRRLMPIEVERLNMFPSDWTKIDDIKESRRGFLMGNALVVGVIERLREPIIRLISRY